MSDNNPYLLKYSVAGNDQYSFGSISQYWPIYIYTGFANKENV